MGTRRKETPRQLFYPLDGVNVVLKSSLLLLMGLAFIIVGCAQTEKPVPPSETYSTPEVESPSSASGGSGQVPSAEYGLSLPAAERPIQEIPSAEARPSAADVPSAERGTAPPPSESAQGGPSTGERAGPPASSNLPALPSPEWAYGKIKELGPDGEESLRTVVIDPGHGGPEPGAAHHGGDGSLVVEKDVNLKIAVKLRELLDGEGYRVIMTRDSDDRAYYVPSDTAGASFSSTRADLQARIDIANAAGADVFVSIHNNASENAAASGTEVWFDPNRPFSHLNLALAQEVQKALVAELRAAGHPVVDRGIKDDSRFRVFQGGTYPIFVLGPPRGQPRPTRATQMPAILGETLFVSNPTEAALMRQDYILDAIARGYRNGIVAYFRLLNNGTVKPTR